MADSFYEQHLGRSEREADRLNEQFDLFTSNIGYLVHPRIKAALGSKPWVADVGTGTGIFLQRLDELQAFPGAVMHGWDLSSVMFPSPVPDHMTLSLLDLKQPIPKELHNKYDLVHARMLSVAFEPSERTPAVANAVQLLKPGGWLQWEEPDLAQAGVSQSHVDAKTDALQYLVQTFFTAFSTRVFPNWNLSSDMQAAGLTSIVRDCPTSDRVPETREAVAVNFTGLMHHLMCVLRPQEKEECERVRRESLEEIKAGCYLRFGFYVACGQKPLQAQDGSTEAKPHL
ncbi:hypothetical protein CDD81_1249 [Ophiocordyceps australis]|uniref:Methyltransferase domain-containing protein n=1 Tax=Ophiocordyceps australis TaxID=1399860 RepID=A0A2C5YEH8_9HYPO|nr:hypothetical protein CDD81_1249 [Ophiocordyceps australis]